MALPLADRSANCVAWACPKTLISGTDMPAKAFVLTQLWVIALLGIALAAAEYPADHGAITSPVLRRQGAPAEHGAAAFALTWSPTLLWALAVSALAAVAIMRVGGPSEFLYWQF